MKKVVHLRIYRGTEILKKENGSISNENQRVALEYGTLEWKNYLKNIPANPFCKVDVEKVLENVDGKYVDAEIDAKIVEEVKKAQITDAEKSKTKEQLRIEELERKLDALLSKDSVKNIDVVYDEVNDSDLDALKAKYKAKFGKNPHHLWKSDTIKEKLAE